jgi:hypothetical protein
MSVDLVHPAVDPAVEKVTLVLEGLGDGKVRVNSASCRDATAVGLVAFAP